MESRSVYRSNYIVYPDLYYIWTYVPQSLYKAHDTEAALYKKHYCGIGFYSRFHARHMVALSINKKALLYIHIIRGDKLIREGITTLPKAYNDRIFVNSPYTKYGDRKIRKWRYPPEFNYDKHRRRHFILYLVRSAEDHGWRAFDYKYKKYFNGYRESVSVRGYLRKKRRIYYKFLKSYRKSLGLPEEGITYDNELLSRYSKEKKKQKTLSKKSNQDLYSNEHTQI